MIFTFTPVQVRQRIPSLHGRPVRLRPMLYVGVSAPGGRARFEDVQLDTGADDVVFSLLVAASLGIDLRSAPRVPTQLADGRSCPITYAPVELTLAESATHYIRWTATVGFAPIPRGLFGFAGGLEFFYVTLDHRAAEFALIPHAHIPATARSAPTPG